ncbi:hypothetical protein [Botryobacter ruber]|uniref:hypothetical protein n=1 Tax=Botryobacter ruber TaxID=2171629 RepID=UPI000F64EDCB|nr:hypothetical protein [Botryobacter ruber]
MMKVIVKYLLTLCFLLLSGYSHLSAYSSQQAISGSPASSLSESAYASQETEQDRNISFSTSSYSEKRNHRIDAAEIEAEEDKLLSFKKFLENSKFLTAVIYAFISGILFRYLSQGFRFYKHFSHLTSYRWHILLQVFRI